MPIQNAHKLQITGTKKEINQFKNFLKNTKAEKPYLTFDKVWPEGKNRNSFSQSVLKNFGALKEPVHQTVYENEQNINYFFYTPWYIHSQFVSGEIINTLSYRFPELIFRIKVLDEMTTIGIEATIHYDYKKEVNYSEKNWTDYKKFVSRYFSNVADNI